LFIHSNWRCLKYSMLSPKLVFPSDFYSVHSARVEFAMSKSFLRFLQSFLAKMLLFGYFKRILRNIWIKKVFAKSVRDLWWLSITFLLGTYFCICTTLCISIKHFEVEYICVESDKSQFIFVTNNNAFVILHIFLIVVSNFNSNLIIVKCLTII